MYPRNLIVGIVATVAVITGALFAWSLKSPPAKPVHATVLPAGIELPEFELVDATGQPVGRSLFEGRWDLLFFGFTHCPDVCPLTLDTLARARRQLEGAGVTPLPRIVLVSVDPERDSPETIARYVGHFGEDIVGITGTQGELRTLTDALGIYFDKVPTGDDEYTVDHSAAVLVVDPEGRFSALFTAPHEVAHFVHDLPLLMNAR